jgi:thioredoxin 1
MQLNGGMSMKKLLKFSQQLCNPCKMLTMHLQSKGVEYEEIDVFENVELASKYGIFGGLPVLILLEDDQVIGRTSGFNPSNTEEVDNLINQLNN